MEIIEANDLESQQNLPTYGTREVSEQKLNFALLK